MCLRPSHPDAALPLSALPHIAEDGAFSLAEPLPLSEKTLAAVWNAQRPLQGPFWTTTHEPIAIFVPLWEGQNPRLSGDGFSTRAVAV